MSRIGSELRDQNHTDDTESKQFKSIYDTLGESKDNMETREEGMRVLQSIVTAEQGKVEQPTALVDKSTPLFRVMEGKP